MLHELTHRHDALVGPAGELEICAWRGTRVVRKVLYRPYPHARVYSLGTTQLKAVLLAKSPEEAMAALRTQSGVQAGVDKRS